MVTVKTLRLGIDARGAAAGAASFGASANKVKGSALGAAGATAQLSKAVAALAAYATLGSAIRVIAGYEERLVVLGKVSGATAAQLELLEKKTKQLGATTRFTAEQAAEGSLELARAGFTVNEQLVALEDTLALATAAELELGEASGFVANTLRQFSLEAGEAARVADTLLVASNNANMDVRQLAESMSYAGTISATFGISVEKTAVAIGALADVGIKGSMAGTNYRGVLLSLADPTEKVIKGLRKLGLEYEDVNPATNDLFEVSAKLSDGFGSLSNAYDAAGIAAQIFGRRNAAAAIALGLATEKMTENWEEVEKSKNAHLEMAEAMDKTIIGKFNALKSATQALMIETGDAGLTGAIKGLLDTMTDAIRILGGMEGALDDAGTAAKLAAAAIAGLALSGGVAGAAKLTLGIQKLAFALAGASFAASSFILPAALLGGAIAVLAINTDTAATSAKEAEKSFRAAFVASEDLRRSVSEMSEKDYVKSMAEGGKAAEEAIATRIKQLEGLIEFASKQDEIAKSRVGDLIPGAAALAALPPGMGQQLRSREVQPQLGLEDFGPTTLYQSEDVIKLAEARKKALETLEDDLKNAGVAQEAFNLLQKDAADGMAKYISGVNQEIGVLLQFGETAKDTATKQMVARELLKAEQEKGGELTQMEATKVMLLARAREWLNGVIKKQIDLETESQAQAQESADKLSAHAKGVAEMRAELEQKIEIEKALAEGRTAAATDAQFDLELMRRRIILGDSEAESLKLLNAELQRLIEKRKDEGEASAQTYDRTQSGVETLQKEIAQRKLLVDSVGMTAESYSKSTERAEIMAEAQALLTNASDEQAIQIKAARDALLGYVDAAYEAEQQMRLIYEGQNAFVDMFSDIITGSESAGDAFEAFSRRMVAAMTEMILKRALMNAFFGGIGADANPGAGGASTGVNLSRGGSFDGGGRRFAMGDVFTQTTPVSYPGGHGVIAEAGSPEAVMPLKRDGKGNLGVVAAGGGGGQTVNNYNVIIKAADYESFRKSRRQISDDFRRMGARN
jgi:TP901 family phage tail tape measure protein